MIISSVTVPMMIEMGSTLFNSVNLESTTFQEKKKSSFREYLKSAITMICLWDVPTDL